MRKKVEYYQGYEITQEVITKINTIAFKRYCERRYGLLDEDYLDLDDLCHCNNLLPEDTYITQGEDWFIIYAKLKNSIELIEWVSLNCTENKFAQTIEMFNEIKKILLSSKEKSIYSIMRHSTSYKFYYDMLTRGYLNECYHNITIEPFLPSDIEKTAYTICQTYNHISNFLKDENRDKEQEELIEDYIYHEISFAITDKFVKRYQK